MSDDIRYPSVRQVERLYDEIIALTGGEHGYISKSNLEYLLDVISKEVAFVVVGKLTGVS